MNSQLLDKDQRCKGLVNGGKKSTDQLLTVQFRRTLLFLNRKLEVFNVDVMRADHDGNCVDLLLN